MRVDVASIIEQANKFLEAINAKSRSRARSEAHKLLCALPDPTWAETVPGCSIWYGDEINDAEQIEGLRYIALTWLRSLISNTRNWEPTAEWPEPDHLVKAIRGLEWLLDPPTTEELCAIAVAEGVVKEEDLI